MENGLGKYFFCVEYLLLTGISYDLTVSVLIITVDINWCMVVRGQSVNSGTVAYSKMITCHPFSE